MFERKWNNSAGVTENSDFVPLPPGKPVNQSPAQAATGVNPANAVIKWYGGPWAHKYDLLIGTDPNNMQPVLADVELGPSQSTTQYQSYTLTNLLPGTTYYWKVLSRTMANLSKSGDPWSFTTAGSAAPPPANATAADGDIVLYAMDGQVNGPAWTIVPDSTAAGGKRVLNPNANAAKIATALASPGSYVDIPFTAVAGHAYHLWMRGRAELNSYTNDSTFVQFTNSLNASQAPAYRIGTTSAIEYSLEDCNGCGVAGWGWQDNAWAAVGPPISFATSGPQTLRLQQREDGLSIDQVILSPIPNFLSSKSPGMLKNDATIYARPGDDSPPPPLTPPWVSGDIGNVGVPGSASFDTAISRFTVKGAGADIWGTADAFQFIYQSLSGDGSIVARVASISSTAAWVKAGVMIRGALTANSAHGMMLVSYSKGTAYQRRATTGGTSTGTSGILTGAPYWVRLDRVGNTVSAYQSPDGKTWTFVASETIATGTDVYIGLAVSSHSTSSAATVTFDNVTVVASTEG